MTNDDLDNLESILEQCQFSTGRKDARGSKRGRNGFAWRVHSAPGLRSVFRAARASVTLRTKNKKEKGSP